MVAGLGLSAAELNTITSSGTLTIGSATHTGTITADGALDLTTSATFTGPTQLYTKGGAIALNNAVTTPGNLTLDTKQGAGAGRGNHRHGSPDRRCGWAQAASR